MRQVVNLETGEITLEDDAPIVEQTPEQIQEQINKDALDYLSSTGWVVEKLSEYTLLGIDTAQHLIKYADILNKRQEARDAIV